MMIAIVDYGAESGVGGQGDCSTWDASVPSRTTLTLWDGADKWIIPGVGNFKATAPLANGRLGAVLREGDRRAADRCWAFAWGCNGCSRAAPRPRSCSGLGVFAGTVHAVLGPGEIAARGLGQHRDRRAVAAAGGNSVGRVRVLHALLPRARCALTRWRPVPTRSLLPRWQSAAICSACSFIPRSQVMWGCRSWRTSVPCETLAKRIIACLDVNAGRVVKGIQFEQIRDAGDPAELASAHSAAGADEIVLLDITATAESRNTLLDTVRRTAQAVVHSLHGGRRNPVARRRGGGAGLRSR